MMANRNSWTRYLNAPVDDAGRNISWSAIIAGVMTFLACMIAFSLIGSAIGLGVPDVTSNQPFEGLKGSIIAWASISLIISLLAAGFVSGVAAARVGLIHGFLTWASSVVVLFLLLTFTTLNIFQATGSLIGKAGSVAGQGVEMIASTAGTAIEKSFTGVTDAVSDVDTQELQGNVQEILRDTDIPELQPNYIQNQLDDSRKDIQNTAKELVLNPENSDQLIKELGDKLQKRADTLSNAADEQAIANAVEKNTDLSQSEAEEATKNIVDGLQQASTQAQEQIQNAQTALEDAQQEVKVQVENSRQSTEEVTDSIARASLWGFVALLVAMIVTSLSGLWGSSLAHRERTMVNK